MGVRYLEAAPWCAGLRVPIPRRPLGPGLR